MFAHIEGLDPEMSKLIREEAKAKELSLQKEREFDRGGFSL